MGWIKHTMNAADLMAPVGAEAAIASQILGDFYERVGEEANGGRMLFAPGGSRNMYFWALDRQIFCHAMIIPDGEHASAKGVLTVEPGGDSHLKGSHKIDIEFPGKVIDGFFVGSNADGVESGADYVSRIMSVAAARFMMSQPGIKPSAEWSAQEINRMLPLPESGEVIMACADEEMTLRKFVQVDDGAEDMCCEHCGWYQQSPAAGAHELLQVANWSDLQAWERYAEIAREGGFEVNADAKERLFMQVPRQMMGELVGMAEELSLAVDDVVRAEQARNLVRAASDLLASFDVRPAAGKGVLLGG